MLLHTSALERRRAAEGGGNGGDSGAATTADLRLKDLVVLPDTASFMAEFERGAEAAAAIERKVRELVQRYNEDNLPGGKPRPVEDWLMHDKIFPLSEHRFPAPRPASLAPYNNRWRAGGAAAAPAASAATAVAAEEVSRLYVVLGTFDATWRRKTHELSPVRLRPEEVEIQLKMASSVFNEHKQPTGEGADATAAANASNQNAQLPDNVRLDKTGFTYPALEFARMLRSPRFERFTAEVREAFGQYLPPPVEEREEEEEEQRQQDNDNDDDEDAAAAAAGEREEEEEEEEVLVVDGDEGERDSEKPKKRRKKNGSRRRSVKMPPPMVEALSPTRSEAEEEEAAEDLEQSQAESARRALGDAGTD